MKKIIVLLAFCALMAASYFYSGPMYNYYLHMYYVKFKKQTPEMALKKMEKLYKEKKYQELEENAGRMLRVYPEFKDLWIISGKNDLRRGEELFSEGQKDKGMDMRRRGADRILLSIEGREIRPRDLEDAIQVYFEDGQYKDIVSALRGRNIKREQNLLYYYGASLFLSGRDREAITALESAIREGRSDYAAYYYLGLAFEKINPAEAINNLEEASKLNYRDGEVKKALARIYHSMGKNYEAEKMIRKGRR